MRKWQCWSMFITVQVDSSWYEIPCPLIKSSGSLSLDWYSILIYIWNFLLAKALWLGNLGEEREGQGTFSVHTPKLVTGVEKRNTTKSRRREVERWRENGSKAKKRAAYRNEQMAHSRQQGLSAKAWYKTCHKSGHSHYISMAQIFYPTGQYTRNIIIVHWYGVLHNRGSTHVCSQLETWLSQCQVTWLNLFPLSNLTLYSNPGYVESNRKLWLPQPQESWR